MGAKCAAETTNNHLLRMSHLHNQRRNTNCEIQEAPKLNQLWGLNYVTVKFEVVSLWCPAKRLLSPHCSLECVVISVSVLLLVYYV